MTNRTILYPSLFAPLMAAAQVFGGAFSQSPERFVKPTPAALQRYQDFTPQGAIVSTTPQGWQFQQPERFNKPFAAAQQQFAGFEFVPPVAAVPLVSADNSTMVVMRRVVMDGGSGTLGPPVAMIYGFSQSPDLFAKPFPAYLQRYQDFTPQGTIVSTTPQGWQFQQPTQFAKPFPAHLQRYQDFTPRGAIVSTTPFVLSQSPDLFAKSFPAYLQRFEDFAPRGAMTSITPQGWWGQSPERFAKPFPVYLQRYPDFTPAGAIVSTTPQGWQFQSPERFANDRFAKTFPAYLQQYTGLYPQVIAPAPVVAANVGGSSEIVVQTGTTISSNAVFPATIIVSAFPDGWRFQDPERFVKPFPAHLQRFQDFTPAGTIVSVTPQGWWGQQGQSPERFAKPFPAYLQRFPDFATFGPVIVTITPSNFGYSPSPERFAKLFPAYLQRVADFVPQGTIAQLFPEGWRFQDPDRFAKSFPAYLQRFEDFAPLGATAATTPQGGYSELWWRFAKAFPVHLQRFQDFVPRGTIASLTPQGWQFQYPYQFAKPFPADLQRAADFTPLGKIIPPVIVSGWWDGLQVKFVVPFPASLQQFGASQLHGTIPIPPIPPIPPRPTLGVVTVIDLNTGSTYGTAPVVNEPFSLLINMNVPGLLDVLSLRFVSPYGVTQYANLNYIYIGPQTVFVKEQLSPSTYIMYNTAPDEFGVSGVWQVFVEAGTYSGGPYLFTVVASSPIVLS